MKNIKVYKLNSEATLPTRNKSADAGLDLYSLEDILIKVGTTVVVKTGVAINIPEGYMGKIEDRSSMAAKGLRTGGGVVDAGYSGDVSVVLHNFSGSNVTMFDGLYQIRRGDKIAQMVIHKVETPQVEEVDRLWSSERGLYGFGSSGA